METKLIRISKKNFGRMCATAARLQFREGRPISFDEALDFLFLQENKENLSGSIEKDPLVHTESNSKKHGKKLKYSKKQSKVIREPIRRFSLKHKKFIAE